MKTAQSIHGWLDRRSRGLVSKRSASTVMAPPGVVSRQLYTSLECVKTWNPLDTDSHRHHGSIFNFDFTTDGTVLVAACEHASLLMFDPNNGKLIGSRDNAHTDSVNCIRFLDSRMFATCSDDCNVCLWDLRNMSQQIRTLRGGHTNMVKNIEFIPGRGILISSAFDGYVNMWDINSYSDVENIEFNRILYIETLMRCRLLPDGSKLIVSTADGYLMVIHDLDLDFLFTDLRGFNPSLYRDLVTGETNVFSDIDRIKRLFTARRNRVELITDFPWHGVDIPGMVPSLEVHPQGWCVVSRSSDQAESCEVTCVHDIQGTVDDVQYAPVTLTRSAADTVTGSSSRTRGQSISVHPRVIPFVLNGSDVVFLPFLDGYGTIASSVENNLTNPSSDLLWSSSEENDEQFENVVHSYDLEHPEGHWNDNGESPERVVSFLERTMASRRGTSSWLAEDNVTTGDDVEKSLSSGDGKAAEDSQTTRHMVCQPCRRLLHYINEPNVGHGYIKEIAFGANGRVIASPFGYGVRVLAFNADCAELCDCVDRCAEQSLVLREVASNVCHGSAVVTTRFSPDSSLLVTGSLGGKVCFHRPRW